MDFAIGRLPSSTRHELQAMQLSEASTLALEGKQFRKSAGTRSWEHGVRKAQAIELHYRQRELGEKPKEHEPVTVEN